MPVLTRSALESSPLADLHEIARELGIDGFRRLRKAELIDAILERQPPGEPEAAGEEEADAVPARATVVDDAEELEDEEDEDDDGAEVVAARESDAAPSRRTRRGGRGRGRRVRDRDPGDELGEDETAPLESGVAALEEDDGERTVDGVVELLGNGSGFVRVAPPEPSDDDVYISAAQVRRCELVDGDRVTGPVRRPRRSERYPSLVRVDTINGRSADEVAEGTPFEELPAAFPSERFALESDDPTVGAIVHLTPIGRGSRATIVGPARAGKTEALRRLGSALKAQDGIELSVVLAGVRPEEVREWGTAGLEAATPFSFAVPSETRGQAVERAVETAKRQASRGAHAVVLIDTLDGLPAATARKALAAARAIVDGGSVTVIATASEPVGGETTVVALDRALSSTGRFPALDLVASGTLRPELLVGEQGAEAIAQARASALSG
jgi:transcription termination factor Rho